MKRIYSITIGILLVISLFAACGEKGAEQQNGSAVADVFSVGYGKADISPEKSVFLCGNGDATKDRMSTGVAERLYATCVAITDAKGNSALLISLDLIHANKNVIQPLREQISEQSGIPFDRIMVACSHNHCGPDMVDTTYRALMVERILQATAEAMESRKPATMETAFARPEGFNYVRHYLLQDGTYVGEAAGTLPSKTLYGHYGKADNLLQLVRFNREGDKPVVLINWQGHGTSGEPNSYTTATPNYPGILRSTIEEKLDCYTSFFLGGSGNLASQTLVPTVKDYENYIVLGKALGEEAAAAANSFQPANTGDIQVAIGYLDNFGKEASAGACLYAMSIGDVAFAFAPFEIFDTNAVAVRNASDFKMTFYATLSNEHYSYLPTDPSFDWVHHYEVRITKYPKGTAAVVQEIMTRLLDDCFAASGNAVVEKEAGYITPEFEPASDGIVYLNPAVGKTDAYTQVANGFCQVSLMDINNNQVKTLLILNAEVAAEVLQHENMKLLFNEQGVVTGIAE